VGAAPQAWLNNACCLLCSTEQRFRVHALCPLPPCDRHTIAGIDVGCVVLDIDGVPISALSDDEVRDLTQQYEDAKLRVTMRPPGSTTVQDRLVYFHRPSEAPSSPGLLGGIVGMFSAATEVLNPGRPMPVKAPPHDPYACFLGLEVTKQPPHAVVAIDDLVDLHLVSQGEPGYSNPVVGVGDRILAVGGRPAEHVPVQELHGLGFRV
jgi:hypothetical protein